jgi:2-oxoisovalerate dehydrogenase E1 component
MEFYSQNFEPQTLEQLYIQLLKPRMIEEKMLILLRQGKISKWFSGIGQEAVSVGVGMVMSPEEYVLPMHRNLGLFTTRGVPLHRLFAQWQGKASGFTQGRDRSFHFGSKEHKIVGMISHLGPQLGIADGIGLAHKFDGENKCALVFTGDGGTSEGDFHEALNVAAVWNLPVIFVIEANGYGLSTPSSEQFKFDSFTVKGPAYGIDTLSIDGNNILEVYQNMIDIRNSVLANPRPFILECRTFRMRGHEEASGTAYVPQELMDFWAEKDPIANYEQHLLQYAVLTPERIQEIRDEITKEIEEGLEIAYGEEPMAFDQEKELKDMFVEAELVDIEASDKTEELRLVDAVSLGLRQSMEKYPELVIMGQDVAEYGGVFKVTEGFVEDFGRERVRNTPLCESAIVGASLGLSIAGKKAVMEMQFADFVTCGFNQIVNYLAKIHWRWGQQADVVIRMPTGAGVNAGPFHSQSNEAWFFHTPGLKIAYPAFPSDAKGLLARAIEDPNPVLFFEHKALYRSIREEVPVDYFNLPFGQAKLLREGEDVSIITYGMGVHWALNYLNEHPDVSADLLDLRTLAPLDMDSILATVRKTGKVLILHEDSLTGGIGAEIAALINEQAFESLDAPVRRLGSLDTPVPFGENLEKGFLANSRLAEVLEELLAY